MHLPARIRNPVTGERIKFDESTSSTEKLVWNEFRPPNIEPPPAHYHPTSEERFKVRKGYLVVETDGTEHQVEADETFVVPPETPHVSYTESKPVHFRREVTPPERWREALTDRFAASHAVGGLSGVTRRFQMILLLQAYPDVIVPARPPRPVQRVLVPVLASIARAIGLKSHYPYPHEAETHREEHKRIVQKYPKVVSSGDFDLIDGLCTDDVVSHVPLGEPQGPDALKKYESPIHEAFPDFDVTNEHLVAEGDHVAMHLTIRGTHQGEMMGIPPTGNQVEFQNMIFHRMENGKIAERWVQPDVVGLLQQLGAIDDRFLNND
ncbi:ester cyclase [Halobium salinum]|uniref:Ester cyclase n=1 Tax=Halobium salinum TaxID=1364940 RepID=A0ABD5PJ01_9EURY|nr:ester cyclase [Halobium salinum]